jgi:hypothetical protein
MELLATPSNGELLVDNEMSSARASPSMGSSTHYQVT